MKVKRKNNDYVVLQNVIDSKLCDEIERHCKNKELYVGLVDDDMLEDISTRNSKIIWINNPFLKKILKELKPIIESVNKERNWECEINWDEKPCLGAQYTTYKEGEYYAWHSDDGSDGDTNQYPQNDRLISITLLLNDADRDFTGGEFQFESQEMIGLKNKGDLIIFTSGMVHRVKEVKSGVRKSLVIWFLKKAWERYGRWELNPNANRSYEAQIFNLGLHKTGTCSFNHLMKNLCIKSLHEPTYDISQHTVNDLKKDFSIYESPPDKCYAIAGGLTSKYKEIYEAWPEAKYVLTIRDPNTWLKSSRNHYRFEFDYLTKNKFGKNDKSILGTTDPQVTMEMLSKTFELTDDEMINIFNNTNQKIIDFFEDKENFMVLNFIDSTDKDKLMKELLDFLDIKIMSSSPEIKFPHINKHIDRRKNEINV